MINLLSDIKKAEIRTARANTILLRYIAVLFAALLFIAGIIFISYQSLRISEESADSQIALPQGSTNESAQSTTTLSEVTSILGSSANIPGILTALAQYLSPDTVIKTIDITPENHRGAPLKLSVYTKQASSSEAIVSSLNSSGVFTGVAIVSTNTSSADIKDYPVKIELSATINSNALQSAQGGTTP